MTSALLAGAALCAALAVSGAHASETYTYHSNPIDGFGGSPTTEFTFSFTVDTPLADGVYNFFDASALPAGFSYVVTDGYLTLSAVADLFSVAGPQFIVEGGRIVTYAVYAEDLASTPDPYYGYPLFYMGLNTRGANEDAQVVDALNPNIVGYDYSTTTGSGHVPIATRGVDDVPGYWTVSGVPEPAPLLTMAAAGLLLAGLARHRRA